MHYTTEIIINQPIDKVVKLFDDPENLKEWQPGLLSFEHFEGEFGEPGSKMRLLYKMGKREIEMIETLLSHNLPEEFTATYEAKNVWNKIKNRFVVVDSKTTKWISENEFRCSGFLRIMVFLFPGSFKKQTLKHMQDFKTFAERNGGS
ncbi:MAG: SRPBCC family protein [Bacteroidota bacterium]